jgi:hypothetical protein
MRARHHNPVRLTVFWPLVLLALMTRLTFGGIPFPAPVLNDPIRDLTKLSIFCDGQPQPPDSDGQHHHPTGSQDDNFLLSEALELFQQAVLLCVFAALAIAGIRRIWMFAPIRGPPAPARTSLCPQGPPA